jgi:catechol 2,3-dioxygenase-like lactoylglutathione lyase family enzyme
MPTSPKTKFSHMDRYDRRMRGRSRDMWWGPALESPDPAAAAAFYSRLLSWPVVHQEPGTSVVKPPQESVFMVFQLAEDYVRPAWPPVTGQQRTMMHLDVQVDDLDAAIADAASLGAELAETQPHANVRVMFDPDGRPFCLCRDVD